MNWYKYDRVNKEYPIEFGEYIGFGYGKFFIFEVCEEKPIFCDDYYRHKGKFYYICGEYALPYDSKKSEVNMEYYAKLEHPAYAG